MIKDDNPADCPLCGEYIQKGAGHKSDCEMKKEQDYLLYDAKTDLWYATVNMTRKEASVANLGMARLNPYLIWILNGSLLLPGE